MGKIVLIAIVLGLGYAWHTGRIAALLEQRDAPPPEPAKTAEPYDPYKRYEGADESPEARCAQARAKLEDLENWARGSKGIVDPGALQQARDIVQERCRS